ncbi:hypothetical protein [Herpetosiphon sp.]|uniref:hypothetical protein n=1 Tax=Herpetosiphon sp. TaxID=71864 RepID=UPI002579FDFE|nr:hypothetical protein [Herpetosiphon sp.]
MTVGVMIEVLFGDGTIELLVAMEISLGVGVSVNLTLAFVNPGFLATAKANNTAHKLTNKASRLLSIEVSLIPNNNPRLLVLTIRTMLAIGLTAQK